MAHLHALASLPRPAAIPIHYDRYMLRRGSSASGAIAPSADPSTSESDSGLGAADGQLACCRHPLPLRLSWRSLVRRCGAVGGGLG